jgi:hypothetical protein
MCEILPNTKVHYLQFVSILIDLHSLHLPLVAAAEGALERVRPLHSKLPPDDDPRRRLSTLLDDVAARLAVKEGRSAGQEALEVLNNIEMC